MPNVESRNVLTRQRCDVHQLRRLRDPGIDTDAGSRTALRGVSRRPRAGPAAEAVRHHSAGEDDGGALEVTKL